MTERICKFCGLTEHVRRTHRNCTARIVSTCESCGREGHHFNSHYSCPLNHAIRRLYENERQVASSSSNNNTVFEDCSTTIEDVSMEALAEDTREDAMDEVVEEGLEEVLQDEEVVEEGLNEEMNDALEEEALETGRAIPVPSCEYCGSTTHRRRSSRQCPFNLNNPYLMARDPLQVPTERDDRGRMNIACSKCSALMWIEERISRSSRSNPRFQLCCCHGSAILEPLKPTPPLIVALLTGSDERSREFRSNIRCYNSSLSFTSMGVNLD
ncbi:hypothetical protein [Parasitella parasitica]|uniref:Uncharacterized protein n=1 Tax=Parasitella parasitica TaxID=35722 RepID=A0A0B7NLX4_9FUNG|nr:hypothetical protein [Parasitella parasitica]